MELDENFSDHKMENLLDEFVLSKNQISYDVFSSPEKFFWFSKNVNYIKLDKLINCIENQYKEYLAYHMPLQDLYFEINNYILDTAEFTISNYISEFDILNKKHNLLTNLINHSQTINDPSINMILDLKSYYENKLMEQKVNKYKFSKNKVL